MSRLTKLIQFFWTVVYDTKTADHHFAYAQNYVSNNTFRIKLAISAAKIFEFKSKFHKSQFLYERVFDEVLIDKQ